MHATVPASVRLMMRCHYTCACCTWKWREGAEGQGVRTVHAHFMRAFDQNLLTALEGAKCGGSLWVEEEV